MRLMNPERRLLTKENTLSWIAIEENMPLSFTAFQEYVANAKQERNEILLTQFLSIHNIFPSHRFSSQYGYNKVDIFWKFRNKQANLHYSLYADITRFYMRKGHTRFAHELYPDKHVSLQEWLSYSCFFAMQVLERRLLKYGDQLLMHYLDPNHEYNHHT